MRSARFAVGCVLLALAVGAPAVGETVRELFEDGNKLYREAARQEGDEREKTYLEAARRYARAASRVQNAHVLYDLGNSYFRAGEMGRAIAAYRRAEILMPRHRSVQRNLTIARDNAPGGEKAIAPHPAAAAFFFWHYALSLSEAEGLAVFFFIACLVAVTVRFFLERRAARRLRLVPIVLGVLALAFAASSVAKLASSELDGAVVVVREASVRSEPAGRAVELHVLREGAEVRVLKRSRDWTRVESGADTRGWIETRAVEFLADAPVAGG